MTRKSRNGRPQKPAFVLAPGALIRILALTVAVLFFLGAHLHLRFRVNQMHTEAVRLQHVESLLKSEIQAMSSENERLKQPERLYDLARNELGMEAIRPAQRRTLRMPEEIYARYESPTNRVQRSLASRRAPRPSWLDQISERIGLSSPAQAGD